MKWIKEIWGYILTELAFIYKFIYDIIHYGKIDIGALFFIILFISLLTWNYIQWNKNKC